MLRTTGTRAALLMLGAAFIARGDPKAQTHPSGSKRAPNVVDHSANDLIGRWVIDPKRSGPVPAGAAAEARKAVHLFHFDFLPGGRYKDYPGGFPGRYEVSGSQVKLFGDEPYTSKNLPPNVAEYDAKAGTLTFSPGPRQVVYVRAPKHAARPHG